MIYYKTDELYHHGIKGQKWGVRRYQNPDGTLTDAGKKRLSKQIANGKYSSVSNLLEKTDSLVPYEAITNIDRLKSTLKAFREAAAQEDKLLSKMDKEYEKASKKAYDATYKFFEKNKPEALKEMLDLNGGSKNDLDKYHGFRKAFEGFEDEYWDLVKKEYYKDPKNLSAKKKTDAAYTAYLTECKIATDSLVGKYGNVTLRDANTPGASLRGTYYSNVDRVVNSAISNYVVRNV